MVGTTDEAMDCRTLTAELKAAESRLEQPDATEADRRRFQKLAEQHPGLEWPPDVAKRAIGTVCEESGLRGVDQEAVRQHVMGLRHQFGFDEAGAAERLVINEGLIAYARVMVLELRMSECLGHRANERKTGYWETRLAAAQKRFEGAMTTFVRIRKGQAQQADTDGQAHQPAAAG